jgi:hypothetical protein
MAVTFELPTDIEKNLRRTMENLDQTAKEAALVQLYRQDRLTHHELSRALGISRIATEAVLKKHEVTEDLPTAAELKEDLVNLRRLLHKK